MDPGIKVGRLLNSWLRRMVVAFVFTMMMIVFSPQFIEWLNSAGNAGFMMIFNTGFIGIFLFVLMMMFVAEIFANLGIQDSKIQQP